MIKRWGKQFVYGLCLGCLFLAAPSHGGQLGIGDSAPLFTLKTVNEGVSDKRYVNLSDYTKALDAGGKKATFLSFFATTCEPCKRELPYLVELHKSYVDQGFQVIVVTIDKDPAEVAVVKKMVTDFGAAFPLLNDRFGIVARRYGVEALPMSFLIDQAGTVKMTNEGYGEDGPLKLLAQTRMALGLPLGSTAPERLWPFVGVPEDVQSARDAKAKKQKAAEKKARKKRKKRRKNVAGTKR
ncbi:MAG: TlpA family protein disulfide reductase [Deltaproteobacteria bacterium]|nr:TlpA family protein disulfide reductase [Deltaproteobacteria bacterium]